MSWELTIWSKILRSQSRLSDINSDPSYHENLRFFTRRFGTCFSKRHRLYRFLMKKLAMNCFRWNGWEKKKIIWILSKMSQPIRCEYDWLRRRPVLRSVRYQRCAFVLRAMSGVNLMKLSFINKNQHKNSLKSGIFLYSSSFINISRNGFYSRSWKEIWRLN